MIDPTTTLEKKQAELHGFGPRVEDLWTELDTAAHCHTSESYARAIRRAVEIAAELATALSRKAEEEK
jgi:hypothetical protein